MQTFDTGLIGLAVMGANLARNIASRGFSTLVYNRTSEKTEKFVAEFGSPTLQGETGSIGEFVSRLATPRKILVMVQAGPAVDAVLDELLPHLEKGDVVVDCGNTHYPDTVRREARLAEKGVSFVGCGVSGGEEGALNGPSLMPGGDSEAYRKIEPVLRSIAAKDFDGGACVTYVGPGGSGHFVKMVHNGIEYAVMQTMAEAYDILRKAYGFEAPEIADVFERYAESDLGSYLFDISVSVLRTRDEFDAGKFLVDSVLDRAGQKGTGKWTVVEALERGVALPSIAEAVFARNVSSRKSLRTELSKLREKIPNAELPDPETFEKILANAFRASVLSAYAQGYDLIAQASETEGWDIDLAEISRIWQGGCIIRAKILSFLRDEFLGTSIRADGAPPHLFEIPEVRMILASTSDDWREVTTIALAGGVPAPSMSAGLAYFDSLTDDRLPANFLQGLRDHFGAHTYERVEREGIFHSRWEE